MRNLTLILGAGLVLAACDDSTGPTGGGNLAGSGSLVISVSTVGGDPDLDGYSIDVDGRISLRIGIASLQELTLDAGPHRVELTEMAANCAVQGESAREVSVVEDRSVTLGFLVSCRLTGVSIRTSTTGLDHDANGYRLLLDGVPAQTMASNSSTVISRLVPGEHLLELTDVAPNCEAEGPTARTLTVVNAELALVEFPVTCRAAWAAIRVEASTAGSDPDGQYRASLVGFPNLTAQVNGGSGYILQVPAGAHQVVLGDVAANCAVQGGVTREATVAVGGTVRDTAEVVFAVECISDRGTIRVTVATSGTDSPGPHRVDLWDIDCYYDYYCDAVDSRETAAGGNGTVEFTPRSGNYTVAIQPAQGCSASGPGSSGVLTVTHGAVLEAEFDVACGPPLIRVTAPTSGTSPDTEYSVTLWYMDWWTYDSVALPLGTLTPGGTLTAEAPFVGQFWVSLGDVAANCTVQAQNPSASFHAAYGQTKDLSFPVVCGP